MKAVKSAKVVAPVAARKSGGKVQVVSGNKNVVDEAEKDEDGMKRGGKVKKRKDGGKVVGLMTGGGVRPRLDRPGRKAGGGVGANTSPLSTAHNTSSPGGPSSADTYGGTPK